MALPDLRGLKDLPVLTGPTESTAPTESMVLTEQTAQPDPKDRKDPPGLQLLRSHTLRTFRWCRAQNQLVSRRCPVILKMELWYILLLTSI